MKKTLGILTMLLLCFFVVSCTTTVNNENTYKITFDSKGGSNVKEIVVKSNETTVEPKQPTRINFIFEGWYEDLSSNEEFKFGTTINKDITLYAKWSNAPEKVFITFDSLGGSEVSSQEIIKGGKAVLPDEPTKNLATFLYWTLNGVEYDFDQIVNSNIKLVAKWQYSRDETAASDLATIINKFNADLWQNDFDVLVSFSKDGNLKEQLFQMRTDNYSLVTNINHGSSKEHYLLVKNAANSFDVLRANYNYNVVQELIFFSNDYNTFNLFNINELNAVSSNFGISRNNNDFTLSFTLSELDIEKLTFINGYLSYFFDTSGLESLPNYEEVVMNVSVNDAIEVTIQVAGYEYKAKYLKQSTKFEINIDDVHQKGELDKNLAVFPIKEGYDMIDDSIGYGERTYYYLVDLEKGYYDFIYFPNTYEFESLDGEILDLVVENEYNTDPYRQLLYLEEDMSFYVKVKVNNSMNKTQIRLFFESYNYEENTEYTMDEYLELTNVSGSYYNPIVIHLNFDYEGYELITEGYFDYINVSVNGITYEDGTNFTYLYKRDEGASAILIKEKNVSLTIKGMDLSSSTATSEDNPYKVTEEFSPYFVSAPGYYENYMVLEVLEDAAYQIISEAEKGYAQISINGNYTNSDGLSDVFRLKKGTYKVYTSTNYHTTFRVKVLLIGDQSTNVILGETYESTIYTYTNVEYVFDLKEDSAFSIDIFDSKDFSYSLKLYMPNGQMHYFDYKIIKNLYLKQGIYKIVLETVYEPYTFRLSTKVLDIPQNSGYSFEFINASLNSVINIEENIFGYFFIVNPGLDSNFNFTSNVSVYMLEYWGYSLLKSSTTNTFHNYQQGLVYVDGTNSGSVTFKYSK